MAGIGRSGVWIGWGIIVGSLLVEGATYYDTVARLEQFAIELDFRTTVPEPRTVPTWLVAGAVAATVMAVALCFSRRVRARLDLRPRLQAPSRHGRIYLGAVAIYLLIGAAWAAGMTYFDARRWLPSYPWWQAVAVAAALLYVLVRTRSVRTPPAEWGWTRGRGVLRELALGAVVALAYKPLPVLVARIDADLLGTEDFWLSVIVAPLVEETIFRGMLYRYLRDRWKWPVAALASSAVFAACHMPIQRWPYVFVGGIVYALLREWRGSLLAPIAAHAYGNLFWVLLRAP